MEKKKRCGSLCCVPKCSKRQGHRFPNDSQLRKRWVEAVKRGEEGTCWEPSKYAVVCREHFNDSDYVSETYYGAPPARKQLKKNAVPSVFSWSEVNPKDETGRKEEHILVQPEGTDERLLTEMERHRIEVEMDIPALEVEIEETTSNSFTQTECKPQSSNTCSTQTENNFPRAKLPHSSTPPKPFLHIDNIKDNPKMIHHFTGLETYEKFKYILSTLGPAAHHLLYKWGDHSNLSTENKFLVTLVKLRTHNSNYELALMANISEFAVGNIFQTWVCFMYHQWKEINIFPSTGLAKYFMPQDFHRKFPDTRIILDGVEIPIQKPKNLISQQSTFSTYKNRNTLKAVVGCTAGGLVNHIPDLYGGSATDRQLVTRSDIADKLSKHDSVMVDKGINVQDLFESKDVKVNIPTFIRKRNRLSCKAVLRDRKISSKRVHIERIIGLAKTYKILCQPLVPSEAALGTQILFCCSMLCNFRRRIVSDCA